MSGARLCDAPARRADTWAGFFFPLHRPTILFLSSQRTHDERILKDPAMPHFSVAAASSGASVLPGIRCQTPWRGLERVDLDPGQRAGGAPACEEGWILLEGAVDLVPVAAPDAPAYESAAGPAALLSGGGIGVRATAPSSLLYAPVGLAPTDRIPQARASAVDAALLHWRDAIHGGCGRIAARHIWERDEFSGPWTFIDHAVLAAGSSVGYHYHDFMEECFVVLGGTGLMTVDDKTFAVGPGSVTWQGIGQDHGIYNPGPGELDFLRLAVAQPGSAFTTIDRHDDLRARHP